MAVEVWLAARPKGRPPRCSFRVTAGAGATAFESSWVSVRYADRPDAEYVATLLDALAARGEEVPRPGRPGRLRWGGALGDDCSARAG